MDLRMTVGGMNCGHCAGSVRKALEGLQEDLQVEVRLEDGQVLISGASLPGEEALTAAVEKAGFRVEGFHRG